MRIAVVGPFVIENYGDHLIRQILVRHINLIAPRANIDVYDVYSGKIGFDQTSSAYCIDELEDRQNSIGYDVIIVAGGSVVHFETLMQKIYIHKEPYPIWKLWAQASRVAAKYGIKLIWNNPEIPLGFSGWEKLVAKEMIQAVDYLSVRDSDSQQALDDIQGRPVHVGPDSAWSLHEHYKKSKLAKALPNELEDINNIVVFHCNNRLSSDDMPAVIEMLNNVQSKGSTVLLLPLAYTNSEDETLKLLQTMSNGSFMYIDRKFGIDEMISIFSRCSLYIGLSFHGAITTASFGGTVVAFDYENRRKTRNLYESMGMLNNYTTTARSLKIVLERILKTGIPNRKITADAKIIELQQKSKSNLLALSKEMTSPISKNLRNVDDLYDIALFETEKRFEATQRLQDISDGYQQCYDLYQDLLQKMRSKNGSE